VAANAKVVDLRKLLAERFPQSAKDSGDFFATGQGLIDSTLGGGLRKGAITEISSPFPSAGSACLIADLVEAAAHSGYFIALIDGRDSFDPAALPAPVLRHLLWVRCAEAIEAFKAADLLLRDGNFPVVLLDLVLNLPNEFRKIPATSWYRLQRLTETSSTALLVTSRRSLVASAHLKLTLLNQWDLQSLEQKDASSSLRLEVTRSHYSLQAKAG
jgi:RecA/RadA recombinase